LEPIGEHVEALLRRLGIPAAAPLTRLVNEWDELAGAPWAGIARPVGLEHGTLVVEVADGAHASLLRYQTGGLVERLVRELGPGLVRSVRLRVRDPKKGR
jgi:hypothetical protein